MDAFCYGMNFYEYDKFNGRGIRMDRNKINETIKLRKYDVLLSNLNEEYDNCMVILRLNGKKEVNAYNVFFIVENTIILKMKPKEYNAIYKHNCIIEDGLVQPNQFGNTRDLEVIAKHFYENYIQYYFEDE